MISAMNTPGSGHRLRLPVSPWPAAYSRSDHKDTGLPVFSGETDGVVADIAGETFDAEIFNRPTNIGGWTAEKVEDYVESRENAHVIVDGHTCPTFAFLCWYFDTAAVISHGQDDHWELHLINENGEVTRARYDGDAQGFREFRYAYLQGSPEEGLAFAGVEITPEVPPAPSDPWEVRAKTIGGQLDAWADQHAGRTLAVPRGAQLTAVDLEVMPDGAGEVLARARSAEHLYELRYPQDGDPQSLDVLCSVDGQLRRFSNLVTGVDEGMGAPAADWAQWILQDSAAELQEPTPKLWETNEPDADLFRIVNNIVRYDEHEAATSHFRTSDELQVWLDEALGNHNAPLVVRALEDVYLVLQSTSLPMFQKNVFDRTEGPDPKISYAPRVFHPWKGLDNWLNKGTGEYSRHPLLQTVMDGQELQAYTASNCLGWGALENDLLPGDAPVGPNTWFIIDVAQGLYSPTCIAFPAAHSLLSVSTDNDGATALIAAREYESRNAELHREADFEKRWAPWLDEDHQLTREEIRAGLAKVEQLIKENHDPHEG